MHSSAETNVYTQRRVQTCSNQGAHTKLRTQLCGVCRALLTGSWRESKEDVVRLDGIDRHSFRLMLEYIYTGEVQPGGLEEMFNLVATSDHVGLFDLRDLCVHRLQQQLDISNSLLMRVCAAEIGCTEVETCASDYVLGDFAQVPSPIFHSPQPFHLLPPRRSASPGSPTRQVTAQ